MKKRIQRLVLMLFIIFLLCGCGNSQKNEDTEKSKETNAVIEEEELKEETIEAHDSIETEEVTESQESEESEEETTEQSVEEAPIAESVPEVTYITEFTSIVDYMGNLDSEKPAIVIYNPEENYIINMQEQQHYQLKKTDQVLFNFKEPFGYGWVFDINEVCEVKENYTVIVLDYSSMHEDQEFFLKKWLSENKDDYISITCYLTPPTE